MPERGRLADSGMIAVLEWWPGHRLTIRVFDNAVLIEAGRGLFLVSRR
ncbi:hypothetical protein [Actinopolyspora mortivallis]|nr:hypothetical protein [Actinopolyspora mortivallis]